MSKATIRGRLALAVVLAFFGGKVLHMAVKPLSLLTTLLMVAGVGLVSHLYPVIIALKIPPVRAMQTD